MEATKTVNVDPVAESVVTVFLDTFFDDCALLDVKTVQDNMELLCEGGWKKSDRAISVSLGDKLLKEFSVMFLGFITSSDFRDECKTAIYAEMALEGQTKQYISEARKIMSGGLEAEVDKGYYVINMATNNPKVIDKLADQFALSFDRIVPFEDQVAQLISELTYEERADIGFCMSNFAYLIRALSKNVTFASYMIGVLGDVAESIGIA